MKSDNQYLKGIAKNTGSNVDGHHTDNYYLKRIEENTKSGSSSGGSSGSGFSGNYNDLTNKPTIPTKTSDLTNDSNFLTGTESSGKTYGQHKHVYRDVFGIYRMPVTITYEDDSTETVYLLHSRDFEFEE